MLKQCEFCGRGFEARRDSARFCGDTCKKRAQRAGTAAPSVGSEAPSEDGPLAKITYDTLDEAGVLETVAGAQALLLARRMETGHETGAAIAALSKQLQTIVDSALASVKRQDAMDEVTRKRDEKLRRARGA